MKESRSSSPDGLTELIAAVPRFLGLLVALLRDPRVSWVDKLIVAAVTAYTLSPLDLLPDFVPVLGHLDDLYLVALAIDRLVRRAGPEVLREHWDGPPHLLDSLFESMDRVADRLPAPVSRRLKRQIGAELEEA